MEKAFCIVLCNSRGTKTPPKSSPRSAKELPRTPQSRPRAETLHAEPLYIDNKPKRHANLWRLFNTSDSFRYEEHRLGNHTQLQPSGRTPEHMEASNISATNASEKWGSSLFVSLSLLRNAQLCRRRQTRPFSFCHGQEFICDLSGDY